jgi:hydrogenase maturation protease
MLSIYSDQTSSTHSESTEKAIDWLIIGYGNTLRSDDGVGYKVAEAVATWNLNRVRSISVHQLTPDLAELITHTHTVIFVDAVINASLTSPAIAIKQLKPSDRLLYTHHHVDPASLLTLTHLLYGCSPIAYQILIPAIQFEFGDLLSSITQASYQLALHQIQHWLQDPCSSLVI